MHSFYIFLSPIVKQSLYWKYKCMQIARKKQILKKIPPMLV